MHHFFRKKRKIRKKYIHYLLIFPDGTSASCKVQEIALMLPEPASATEHLSLIFIFFLFVLSSRANTVKIFINHARIFKLMRGYDVCNFQKREIKKNAYYHTQFVQYLCFSRYFCSRRLQNVLLTIISRERKKGSFDQCSRVFTETYATCQAIYPARSRGKGDLELINWILQASPASEATLSERVDIVFPTTCSANKQWCTISDGKLRPLFDVCSPRPPFFLFSVCKLTRMECDVLSLGGFVLSGF